MPKKLFKYTPRKRFAQNFLQDQSVIQKIITTIAAKPKQNIVEIGPGLGALTFELLPHVEHLDVIELDRDLINYLKNNEKDKITIHNSDVLQFDFFTLKKQPLRIIGNLPYNISTPLIFHLLTQANLIDDMIFMLQKEVVDRLSASADTSTYSRLSVMVQYYCQVKKLFSVPATAFNPQPKVESAMVYLKPHHILPYKANDETLFADIVKQAFTHRRKTIFNNLNDVLSRDAFNKLNIDPNLRPQQLTVECYVQMSNYLISHKNKI